MATDDEQQPDGASSAASTRPQAEPPAPPRSAPSTRSSAGSPTGEPAEPSPRSSADSSDRAVGGTPDEPTTRQVRAYRTPRYSVFLVTGAVLGLAAGVAIALLGGSDEPAGSATGAGVLGYFAAFGTLAGALLAGTLAVVVESLLNRGRRGRARPGPRRRPGGSPPR